VAFNRSTWRGVTSRSNDSAPHLAEAPEIPANLRLTGLRGFGTTVLLRRFDEVATEAGWAAALLELEPRHNGDERLTALLRGHLERLQSAMFAAYRLKDALGGFVETARRSFSVSIEGFEWSLGGDLATRTTALAQSLAETVSAASRAGREGVVLLFGGDHPMSMLLVAVSCCSGKDFRWSSCSEGYPP